MCAALELMSWRRFLVLVQGLSANAALWRAPEKPKQVTDPARVRAFLDSWSAK